MSKAEYELEPDTLDKAFKNAEKYLQSELTKQIVRETLTDVKKLYAPEIKRKTRKWAKDNKELILTKYVDEAKAKLMQKFEDVIEENYYE